MGRGCDRYGWLVLNGRAPSDAKGLATCYHRDTTTVLDLVLVPREARADMGVLQSFFARSHGHRAVWGFLEVAPAHQAASPPSQPGGLRCVPVSLTPA